jgi:H+/Cl- antiporter ClcA
MGDSAKSKTRGRLTKKFKIFFRRSFQNLLQRSFLSILCGILCGTSVTLFLILLEKATETRNSMTFFVWGLPLAGFLLGLAYHYYGKGTSQGHNLILNEIYEPKKRIPLRMAPFILISTLLTHLFGGSAGREGTAVQIGASLSDQISKTFDPKRRRTLLIAGMGGGFSAAMATPWAGAIFAIEVLHGGKFRFFSWIDALVASFCGFYVTTLLQAPHSSYPKIPIPPLSTLSSISPSSPLSPLYLKNLALVIIAGLLFGLAAKLFILTTRLIEKAHSHITFAPLRPAVGGLFLVILFYVEGSYRYTGLGLPHIQESFHNIGNFKDPLFKSFFTSLTLGSGFKGGEFIPLVYIGTTLGSALSLFLPISFQLLAALGFASVFAGASKTPLACTFMCMELFGLNIAPFAFLACYSSYISSGNQGIYSAQKRKKSRISFLNLSSIPLFLKKKSRKSNVKKIPKKP